MLFICVCVYMRVGTTQGMVTFQDQKITRAGRLNLGKAVVTAGTKANDYYSCVLTSHLVVKPGFH